MAREDFCLTPLSEESIVSLMTETAFEDPQKAFIENWRSAAELEPGEIAMVRFALAVDAPTRFLRMLFGIHTSRKSKR